MSSVQAKETIIEKGFDAFEERGVEAAWNAWAKDGPMEGGKELLEQISKFRSMGASYGGYISHDYYAEKELNDSTKIVYVIMNMEYGPMFGRFMLFDNSKGILTLPYFNFHTHPENIWPTEIFAD
jgi:hypothetical protein